MHTVSIETERLSITVFDEDNRHFMPDEVFETKEAALEKMLYLISCYDSDNTPLVYPILLKSGQHIGHVETVPIDQGWEVGFHVGKCYTRKGYATEAVKAFLPIIMEQLELDEMFGICLADNAASRKVLEKCGFLLEFDGMGPYHGETQHICRYKWIAL